MEITMTILLFLLGLLLIVKGGDWFVDGAVWIAEATGVSINTALGRMRYAVLNMRRIASDKNIVLTR